MVDATPLNSSACERSERSLASNWCLLRGHYRFVLSEAGRQGALIRCTRTMVAASNRGRVVPTTRHVHESRLMRRTGEIQVDYNARTTQNSRIVLPGAVSPLVSRAEVAQ